VFESFEKKEIPIQVTTDGSSLFSIKHIPTDEIKAKRILSAVPAKISREALNYVKLCFLAVIDAKEIALIHFLKEGFKYGANFIQVVKTGLPPSRRVIAGALDNVHLSKIQKGIDLLNLESQRFIQFVRFSEFNGALVSIIEPENIVLPLMADHFTDRYPNEQFLIYDKTNKLGLFYANRQTRIEAIVHYEMPDLSRQEKDYQNLWRLFYDTIAIEERRNERCRMNFMPKKYWKNMTEFTS